MDEGAFVRFLKRGGRSASAIRRCTRMAREFEAFVERYADGKAAEEAGPEALNAFVQHIEAGPKASAKTHLWALGYYFSFTGDEEMRRLAGALREARIERSPFPLAGFRGVDEAQIELLARAGIRNVQQMLEAGSNHEGRQAVAERAGVPYEVVLELVKLSDLARIPGIKGIRARLYYNAGVDTITEMARWEPGALRAMLVKFVEETGFDGIAPLPAEAAFSVMRARELPGVVEYQAGPHRA